MKHLTGLAAGAVALAAFCSTAAADGMVRRKAAPPPPPVVQERCAGPWTGFYVGGNLGFVNSDHEFKDHDHFFSDRSRFSDDDDAFTIGAQAGYNLQCGSVVFGVEGDINWIDIDNKNKRWGWSDEPFHHARSTDWFGTIRGRIGWTNDRILVYATGGVAFTDFDRSFDGFGWDGGYGWSEHHRGSSNSDWGWVAGGGIEWMHSDRISFKAEALWVDFEDGSRHDKIRFWTCDYYDCWSEDKKRRFSHDDNMWVARVGVNFKFGMREPVYEPMK